MKEKADSLFKALKPASQEPARTVPPPPAREAGNLVKWQGAAAAAFGTASERIAALETSSGAAVYRAQLEPELKGLRLSLEAALRAEFFMALAGLGERVDALGRALELFPRGREWEPGLKNLEDSLRSASAFFETRLAALEETARKGPRALSARAEIARLDSELLDLRMKFGAVSGAAAAADSVYRALSAETAALNARLAGLEKRASRPDKA